MIFLDHRGEVFDELFDPVDQVRVDVRHHATNHVVVLNQSSSRGFFHDVQHLLPVTETVEESGQRSHIHAEA